MNSVFVGSSGSFARGRRNYFRCWVLLELSVASVDDMLLIISFSSPSNWHIGLVGGCLGKMGSESVLEFFRKRAYAAVRHGGRDSETLLIL